MHILQAVVLWLGSARCPHAPTSAFFFYLVTFTLFNP